MSRLLALVIAASGLVVGTSVAAHADSTTYTIATQADFTAASARTYQPGDQILLERGVSFSGSLVLQGSGTTAAPITIDATGTGAAPAITAVGATSAIQLIGVSNYVVQNLDISAPSGAGIEVQLAASPTSGVSGITIRHNVFHNIQNTVDNTRQLSPEYNAVENKAAVMIGTWHNIYADMTNYAISDVTVDSNEFYGVHNGVYVGGNESQAYGSYSDKPRNSNITTENNYFHDIIGEGTVYLGTVNSLITDNSYINVSHDPGTHVAPVWMVGSSYITIQRNKIVDAVPSDGMAVDFDWRTDNSVYQYNYSERNGEFAYPCSVYDNYNNVIRYNISYDDVTPSENCYDSNGGEINLQVYNNTLVNFAGWNLHAVNATFTNNIIDYASTSDTIAVTGSATFSHNLYVNHTGTETGAVNVTDPLFVHPGVDPQGFKLQSTSPAIGAGAVVADNGSVDYFGDAVPSTSAPDIGASQYSAADAPASSEWNLAEGATITASSAVTGSSWTTDALNNGQTHSYAPYGPNHLGYASSSSLTTNHTEWVTVDFGSQRTFNKVVLYPRTDNGTTGTDFPSAFQIQVWNGASWVTRVSKTGYLLDDLGGQEFTWGRDDYTNKIRINATTLTNGAGDYRLELAGLQVFDDSNLAAGTSGATVQTSSSAYGSGWLPADLVDGFTASVGGELGWSSATGITTQHSEWAEIDLPGIQTFSQVIIYPRNDAGEVGAGFPTSFEIQVWDGTYWETRVTETDYPTPTTAQTFTWGHSDTTDKIRIVGTALSQVGTDYVMQLAEVQVS
ncbi:hypothetical protein GXW83_24715 [Streptacidiphilus sp. PB12-B1b]|uniref:discoidin domain-containing protein n=1 Tax=Streptacidiphilus TaxID=228398 RepID=UPI0013648DDB|nr:MULTISPECIES: discoidin domain-containing protein [Streptacidiphilus]QMU78434.1 hypothetical protein GXW83_24715 [Streptacidiphilus sp. PB12-B1b]